MATTSVGTDRKPYQAAEKYDDAFFITDDKWFYFGNDGDFGIKYDELTDNRLKTQGTDLQFSDTQKMGWGDANDATINWDSARLALGGTWDLSGADMQFSDTQKLEWGNSADIVSYFNPNTGSETLMLTGLMASDPVIVGGVYTSDGTVRISGA